MQHAPTARGDLRLFTPHGQVAPPGAVHIFRTLDRPKSGFPSLKLGGRAASGAAWGAGLFLVFYGLCAILNARLGYQGNENALLERRVWSEWRPTVLWQVARLLVGYVGIGALLGAWVGWGLAPLGLNRRGHALGVVLALVGVEALMVAADVSHHPHLYATTLWDRSDALRGVLLSVQGLSPTALRAGVIALLTACALPRFRRAWRASTGRLMRPALGAGLLAALASGFLSSSRPRPARGAPNLLVLAADGLRPDRITPRTAPHLTGLMQQGTRFNEVLVDIPRTAPSWTTLLTSQPPAEHGVRHTLVGSEVGRTKRATLG
ncbi:MAG TPA: alkaline phosphatase family protein, partial [Myxococcaceae bacterium]|nr:alkaline phosphatase family protein [Myxococcaceae bacterium]